MNCHDIQEQLPLYLYEELSQTEAERVRTHLQSCSSCQQIFASYQKLQQTLTQLSTPPVQVDTQAIYQQSAQQAAQRSRRWKRTAMVATAVAASILLLFSLSLDIRVENHQLVIRWGTPATVPSPTLPPANKTIVREVHPDPKLQEQVQILSQLVHALSQHVDQQDQDTQLRYQQLLQRFSNLESYTTSQLQQLKLDFQALYRHHFILSKKGENQ